jgi:hypothetical protein
MRKTALVKVSRVDLTTWVNEVFLFNSALISCCFSLYRRLASSLTETKLTDQNGGQQRHDDDHEMHTTARWHADGIEMYVTVGCSTMKATRPAVARRQSKMRRDHDAELASHATSCNELIVLPRSIC